MFISIVFDFIYSNALIILALIFIYFIIKEIYDQYNIRKNLPCGPLGLPFLGCLLYIKGNASKQFVEWSKVYGQIFSLQLGSIPIVVLNDWQSIKEALSKDSVNCRPGYISNLTSYAKSFAFLSGSRWKEQTKFTLYNLRNLKFGKISMEEHIIQEIGYMCEEIDTYNGNEIDLRNLFIRSVSNNIISLIFGRRFHYKDENRYLFDKMVEQDINLDHFDPVLYYPILSRFIPFIRKHYPRVLTDYMRQLDDIATKMCALIRDEVKSHLEKFDENNYQDYIDAFIVEMEKKKNDLETTFNYDCLESNINLLIGASAGAVLISLEWSMLILANNEVMQKRLHQEIDDIIGNERKPMFSDRTQMPYCQAFIWEVWRFRTIAPLSIARWTTDDTLIQGYNIPKGTQVWANLWALDNDPNLWDNPNEFRPQRFLSSDGKHFTKPEYLIPFSIGKRSCPGESVAVVEVFLYLTALLQKYHIKGSKNTDTKLEYKFKMQIMLKNKTVLCFNERK